MRMSPHRVASKSPFILFPPTSVCWVHAALFHHFKEPIMITEGKMQYLYDERGRRYLDVCSCLL